MRARSHCTPRTSFQRGLALVETAIALPLLLLLLLSVGEFGRVMYFYNTLQKTTRDAARYLADNAICDGSGVIQLQSSDPCGVQTPTKNLAVYGSPVTGTPLLPNLAPSNVTLSAADATHVRVQVNYTYTPIFTSFPTFGLTANKLTVPTTFSVIVTMRAL